MEQAKQLLAPIQAAKNLSLAQVAWLRFVNKVERGEAVDPAGQYVAKATSGSGSGSSRRVVRPKFDAAMATFAQHYSVRKSGEGVEVVAKGGTGQRDSEICYDCGVTGGGGPSITSSFTTSENQGGSGQIHDLKLVGSGNSTSRAQALNAGYILLDADLNKGAGGAYVYLCFVRDAANVLSGLEYYQGQANSAPLDILTSFTTQNGSTFSKPTAAPRYFDVWSPNQNPYYDWSYVDLNAGAGGEYIYSFQSKSNQITAFNGYVSEVGILSGNSASILPPAGWIKYPHDLNEGAGGDFIYFRYKY